MALVDPDMLRAVGFEVVYNERHRIRNLHSKGAVMSNSRFYRVIVLSLGMILAGATAQAQSETVIHSFSGPDGAFPFFSSLVVGPGGALYGTTYQGGNSNYYCSNGCGTVFKLTGSGSSWTETVIYSFGGGPDGSNPAAGVVFGPDGSLYGTTYEGGSYGYGAVYQQSP